MQRSAKAWSHGDRFKNRGEDASRPVRHVRSLEAGTGRRHAQRTLWAWGATLLPFIGISLVYTGIARGDVALSTLLASFACGIFLIRFCKGM